MEKRGNRFIDRTGEKWITNEGYWVEIVKCNGRHDCDIRFTYNNVILKKRSYKNIVEGVIKNPYHPSVYGKGYTGIGRHKSKVNGKNTIVYEKWKKIIQRAYDEKHNIENPSYLKVTVCEEWLNFQNFGAWFEENFKSHMDSGWHLDKDILIKGNKYYSPETCCLVPRDLNNIILKSDKTRGDLPIGVYWDSKVGKYMAQLSRKIGHSTVGYFTTIEETFNSFKTAKEEEIKRTANLWKPLIAEKTYNALYNWNIEITD